jgi:hypothetical protein
MGDLGLWSGVLKSFCITVVQTRYLVICVCSFHFSSINLHIWKWTGLTWIFQRPTHWLNLPMRSCCMVTYHTDVPSIPLPWNSYASCKDTVQFTASSKNLAFFLWFLCLALVFPLQSVWTIDACYRGSHKRLLPGSLSYGSVQLVKSVVSVCYCH